MESLRGLLGDNQKQPITKPVKKKSLPLIGSLDYCYRYRPLTDRSTFQQELDHTQGEVVAYFPSALSQQYQGYLKTTKYMTIAFWVFSLGFAGLCHKISFISRILGDGTWKMFGFKLTSLVVPFLAMDRIMPSAEAEEINFLWEGIGESYKRYKYTGDILQLNSKISLIGVGLQSVQSDNSNDVNIS